MSTVKKIVKKIIKTFLLMILLFIVYIISGIILLYKKQPAISREYMDNFHTDDFYSDSVSCDRAYIVENNEEALLQRLRMIEHAQNRIILSTFEFMADDSGTDVIAALLAAAKRGVNVKIIVDGMSGFSQMNGNKYFCALAAAENVEIKIYNKLNLFTPWKLMGRLHDKYVIVDYDLYLLGGRNTNDRFLGADNDQKCYDRDVLVYSLDPDSKESSIHQLEDYFESVWELKDSKPFKARSTKKTLSAQDELEKLYETLKAENPAILEKPDYTQMTFETRKITLLSNPIHVYAKEPTLFYSLTEIMKHSQGEIYIHTPYIICNDWMYNSFREICEINPGTVLMTNSAANNANLFGASDYLLHKDKLVDTGLTIYEYEGGISYHGKSLSVGDRLAIVGSFNMDMRSAYLDTELMLVIDSEAVNRQLREHMGMYEASAAKVLDEENYMVPENVTQQKLTTADKLKINFLKIFNWLRFLM